MTDGNGGIAFAPFRDGETRSLIACRTSRGKNGRTPENCFGVLFYGDLVKFLKRKGLPEASVFLRPLLCGAEPERFFKLFMPSLS